MIRLHKENVNAASFGNPEHEYQREPKTDRDPLYSYLIPRIPAWVRTVLDCGCGFGIGTRLLHLAGFAVNGCDISKPRLESARRRCPDLSFFIHDLANPLEKRYDCIVAVEVLEHLDDPIGCLNNWAAMSKIVLVTVPRPGKLTHYPEHIWDFEENDLRPPLTWIGDASTAHRAGMVGSGT